MPKNYVDAVCSVCQRMIRRGATLKRGAGLYVMDCHPAAGVFIDVKSDNWRVEFDPNTHFTCEGEGTGPEYIKPAR